MWAGEQNEEERSIATAREAVVMGSLRMDAGVEGFFDRYDNEESVDVSPSHGTQGRAAKRARTRAASTCACVEIDANLAG